MNEKYNNFIYDLGVLLKDMGVEAAEDYRKVRGEGDESYKLGYLMAFHRVLTLMQQQAENFDISQEEIGMADFDADSDL